MDQSLTARRFWKPPGIWAIVGVCVAWVAGPRMAAAPVGNGLDQKVNSRDQYRTFGGIGKQLSILTSREETELFRHNGKGCLTHMWFGGNFKGIEQTRIRIYVDGEQTPSIDMELFMGHAIGFADDAAPWGTARMGKTGHPSGIYNTYRIPFGSGIRITAQLAPGSDEHPQFWWIFRGTENLPVMLGGVALPDQARLRLHRLEGCTAKPIEGFALCDVKGDGAIYQVALAARGLRSGVDWKDQSWMEACMRAYLGDSPSPCCSPPAWRTTSWGRTTSTRAAMPMS